jgi:hypothetical protein
VGADRLTPFTPSPPPGEGSGEDRSSRFPHQPLPEELDAPSAIRPGRVQSVRATSRNSGRPATGVEVHDSPLSPAAIVTWSSAGYAQLIEMSRKRRRP